PNQHMHMHKPTLLRLHGSKILNVGMWKTPPQFGLSSVQETSRDEVKSGGSIDVVIVVIEREVKHVCMLGMMLPATATSLRMNSPEARSSEREKTEVLIDWHGRIERLTIKTRNPGLSNQPSTLPMTNRARAAD